MTCCQPPLGLGYLRGLLGRRQDIAVNPTDALDHEEPPPDVYFYRPGELLVPVAQIPLFEEAAKRAGIGYVVVDRSQPPDRSGKVRDDGAAVRVAVLARDALPAVLDRLDRASGGHLLVSPNHVVFGCPGWRFNPYGEPEPSDRQLRARTGAQASVLVAIVDSGLPTDFSANALLGDVPIPATDELETWGYEGPSPVLRFPQGHGSAVTGVVCQTSSAAVAVAYMALDDDGVTDEWYLGRQLDLALSGHPAVINLSLGTYTRGDLPLLGLAHLQAAIMEGGGPIVVAAAGNCSDDRPFFPAASDWVIGVGAVRLVDHGGSVAPVRAWFSNWGPWVDVCAVGVDIHTAFESHPYQPELDPSALRFFRGAAIWSGTSFAAPAVSGRVADMLALDPGLDREGVLLGLAEAGGATVVATVGVYVPWPL